MKADVIHKAKIIKVPFKPRSLFWWIAKIFIRLTFKKEVRDTRHTIALRKKWERSSSLLKLMAGVTCTPFHHAGLRGEWIEPVPHPTSVMLYLHGGGYSLGSLNTHRSFVTCLSHITNTRIFHLDYRLAPEHPFPAALDDAFHAYEWLLTEKKDSPLYIAGDSAGGGLALALLLAIRDKGVILPNGVICFSPWADLTHQGESIKTNLDSDNLLYAPSLPVVANLYIGNSDPYNPYLSPVYGDFKGMPPLLVQVAHDEILFSDSCRIFDKVNEARGEITLEIWENVFHAWPYAAALLNDAKEALFHVKRFMENCQNYK